MPKRRLFAGAAVAMVGAMISAGILTDLTEAQRYASKFAETEFTVTVAPRFQLEGSSDGGDSWRNGEAPVQNLSFSPDQLALQVGEGKAIFAPMSVRLAAGANTAVTAHATEDGLDGSDFSLALRGEIYRGVQTCDAEGTEAAGAEKLTSADPPLLRGQVSEDILLEAPTAAGAPGPAVDLCVKVWLDNNNWLLLGDPPPEKTATWTVTATP